MGISANLFIKKVFFSMRARPLTIKEVLQLRDGMEIPRTPDTNYPYQIQKVPSKKRILLALN
jgi:hypothetical protein